MQLQRNQSDLENERTLLSETAKSLDTEKLKIAVESKCDELAAETAATGGEGTTEGEYRAVEKRVNFYNYFIKRSRLDRNGLLASGVCIRDGTE